MYLEYETNEHVSSLASYVGRFVYRPSHSYRFACSAQ